MAALVLHLSDIHIKSSDDPILSRGESIAACLYASLPLSNHVFIVVSGDIAYSGKREEFDLALIFLRGIASHIQKERDVPVDFIVAPGNHDCDFKLDNGVRQIAIKHLTETASPTVDESVIEQCTKVQAPYFSFCRELLSTKAEPPDKLWQTLEFIVEGKTVTFDCLNISWVSKKNEEYGGLYFPFERYQTKELHKCDVRILVMHHPLNWFSQASYRPFRLFIRKLGNILITGHEHLGNVGENIDSESGYSTYIEGAVLQEEDDPANSSFYLVQLELTR